MPPLAFTSFEDIELLQAEIGQHPRASRPPRSTSRVSPTRSSPAGTAGASSPNQDISNTNLSPYLAVNWDPFRDGKTKRLGHPAGGTTTRSSCACPLKRTEPARSSTQIETRFVNGEQVIPPGAFGLDRAHQRRHHGGGPQPVDALLDELTLGVRARALDGDLDQAHLHPAQVQGPVPGHRHQPRSRRLRALPVRRDTGWRINPSQGQGDAGLRPLDAERSTRTPTPVPATAASTTAAASSSWWRRGRR